MNLNDKIMDTPNAETVDIPVTPDVWTEAKCIQLIHEFRKRSLLWDQKNPMFYKKAMKARAWVQIGKVLNIPASNCSHKMVILMSSYRREKAKIVKHLKSGNNPKVQYLSGWFGFKEMAFLMDKETERKRKLMETTDDDIEDYMSASEATSSWPAVHQPIDSNSCLKRPFLEKDKQHIQNISVKEGKDLMEPSTLQNDEIKYFSNFIASKLMKYSEKTKNQVQQAICEIIFKADMDYYESNVNNCSVKSCEEDSLNNLSDISQLPSSSDGGQIKIYYSDSD